MPVLTRRSNYCILFSFKKVHAMKMVLKKKNKLLCRVRILPAVTRIRTGVVAATTQSTNHYTITANYREACVGFVSWALRATHTAEQL